MSIQDGELPSSSNAHRRARYPYIEYTMQHAVAFMGVNIYAATIIVYIIAGIANADKRTSDLQYDESRVGKPRLGTR